MDGLATLFDDLPTALDEAPAPAPQLPDLPDDLAAMLDDHVRFRDLDQIWDDSVPTPRGDGRFFLTPGDPALGNAARIEAAPDGRYIAAIHGDPDNPAVRDDFGQFQQLSPADLAELIERDPSYHPGQPVWLFSCYSGSKPDGFAQNLADHLQADVYAPDTLTHIGLDGRTHITPGWQHPVLQTWFYDYNEDGTDKGHLVQFSPRPAQSQPWRHA